MKPYLMFRDSVFSEIEIEIEFEQSKQNSLNLILCIMIGTVFKDLMILRSCQSVLAESARVLAITIIAVVRTIGSCY